MNVHICHVNFEVDLTISVMQIYTSNPAHTTLTDSDRRIDANRELCTSHRTIFKTHTPFQ